MDEKYYDVVYEESPFGTLSQYMTRTFAWMFGGLLLTFAVALATAISGFWIPLYMSNAVFVLSIVELVLVVVLSARLEKLQPGTATALFLGYAVLTGLNFSVYFIAYDVATLMLAFLMGAVYFGVMAAYGWRTGKDLSGWGPMLLCGLVALIIVSLLSMLLGFGFGAMELIICAVGLVIFMGFTAYDTQKLKYYYSYFGDDEAMLHKSAIIGALNLYLDYINIFIYILRILGRNSRRN